MKKFYSLASFTLVFMLALSSFTSMVQAQYSFDSRATGNWNTAGTWIKKLTGTATFTSGSMAVTGTGTLFTTELSPGDILMFQATSGTVRGTVATITDDTHLTLVANAATNAGAAYGKQAIPGASDDVSIVGGTTVTLDVSTSCNSLAFSGNGTTGFTVSGANSLTVAGAFTMDNSGNGGGYLLTVGAGSVFAASLTMAGGGNGTGSCGATLTSGTLSISSAVSVTGNSGATTIDVSAGTFNAGSLAISATSPTGGRVGKVTIGTGTANVSGNISFPNNTGGNAQLTFSGNGTLNLAGNFGSGGTFTAGTGTVNFNGSSSQSLAGAYTFNILSMNNSGSGVTLGAANTVSGSLSLTTGLITTTSSNLLTLNSGASVSGANDNSFVNGPVKKIGNTAFTFPTGKLGTGYMKLDIANLSGSASTQFTAEYFRASAKATYGTAGLTSMGFQSVSGCEYWILSRAVTASTADVTMSWNAHSPCGGPYLVDPVIGIQIVHFNTGTSQWDAHGGGGISGNAAAGSVTWTGVSSFSPFALGALAGSQSPLPVRFGDIKGAAKNNGIQVDWNTYTEISVDHFEIERSADGKQFSSIGRSSANNTSSRSDYSFFDAMPSSGSNFYRIKEVDIDGKLAYSTIIRVDLNINRSDINVFPNPVKGGYVSFQSPDLAKGNYNVKVLNSSGQQVYNQRFTHNGGSASQSLQLPSAIKAGVYYLQVQNETISLQKMFLVQ